MNKPARRSDQRWIRPLPERVINKIAAGEVIERPAAVIKELVENAVDAGADRIDVVVEKSGTRLIRVVDNGCGIGEEQVEIAFSRHATSKIRSFDDLDTLFSYGFRGEALPSIASVSHLRMVTRTHDAAAGTEIVYEGGVLQSKQPLASPPGTTVEVEHLFSNTPARRKFLRAETTEARHISRTAMGLALGQCALGFSYALNGRSIFALPSGSGLKERVSGVLGPGSEFIRVEGEAGPVRVEGYIGKPDMLQNNRYGQFIFVNSRHIQSSTLSHALISGYGDLVPRGLFPVGALLLTVDPSEVDVNVHPTKAEVRLSREREIYDAVRRIVGDSLRQDVVIPTFRGADVEQRNASHSGSPRQRQYPAKEKTVIPGVRSAQTDDRQLLAELYRPRDTEVSDKQSGTIRIDTSTGEVVQQIASSQKPEGSPAMSAGFRLIGRFSDLYLLVQSGDDLYIVDQHTAHERVLFEETLAKIDRSAVDGQNLLFPVQVELNPEQLALFDEAAELMNGSGFRVDHFGGRVVKIEAVPTVLSRKPPEKSFLSIIDDVASLKKAGYDLKKAMAQSIACRSAVMAGDRLSNEEATYLLASLLKCENKYSCPHGRPTFVRIGKADLDRQFGRG